MKELGTTAQKVLLLLAAGLSLGLSRSPTQYFKILKATGKDWKEINKNSAHRAIKNLYIGKLIYLKTDKDGVMTVKLSNKGKRKAQKYELFNMNIPKMKKWDGKWRVVMFDIPEIDRKDRDALRYHLKKLDFFEYQKSVFVHPFDCKGEIDFLTGFYDIKLYVRFMVVESMDDDSELKKYFGLS